MKDLKDKDLKINDFAKRKGGSERRKVGLRFVREHAQTRNTKNEPGDVKRLLLMRCSSFAGPTARRKCEEGEKKDNNHSATRKVFVLGRYSHNKDLKVESFCLTMHMERTTIVAGSNFFPSELMARS